MAVSPFIHKGFAAFVITRQSDFLFKFFTDGSRHSGKFISWDINLFGYPLPLLEPNCHPEKQPPAKLLQLFKDPNRYASTTRL